MEFRRQNDRPGRTMIADYPIFLISLIFSVSTKIGNFIVRIFELPIDFIWVFLQLNFLR